MELMESEELYRMLFENSQISTAITTIDGKIVTANKNFFKMTGYGSEEIYQIDLKTIYRDINQRNNLIEILRKEGKVRDYEVKMIRKNGQHFLASINTDLISYQDEDAMLVTAIDITERKLAENKIYEQAELLEITHDAIILRKTDGEILFWNKGAENLYGWDRGVVKGKITHEILKTEFPHPYEKIMGELLNKGQWQGELIHQTKSGQKLVVLSRWALKKSKDSSDNQVMEINMDVTERKHAETILKESENKYKTLFESDPDYTILISREGILLDVNDAMVDLTGLSKKELVGKNFTVLNFLLEKEMEQHIKQFEHDLKGNKIEAHQYQIIDRAGIKHWINTRIIPLKSSESVKSILVISTDITDIKKAEEKLKLSLKEKEVLLREIHHRVKNNMQIISSLLNLQAFQLVDDEIAVDVLKESQNRVKSMAMVHENLYLSPDLTHIAVDDYIKRLVPNIFYSYSIMENQIKPNINVENIKLNIETVVPCGLIINELVSNSLKHAFPDGKKGEVKVSLKKMADKYILIISDDGIGFPRDLDYKNTDSLGLQLVNNLVKQINGTISMDTNHGTTFRIIFEELKYKDRT